MIPNKLLLPCRSEATYNCLIRHLLGWIGFLTQAYHEIHSLGMLRGAFYMIIRLDKLQFRKLLWGSSGEKRTVLFFTFTPLEIMPRREALWAGGCSGVTF